MTSGPVVGSVAAPGKLQAVNNSKIPAINISGRILFININSSYINTSLKTNIRGIKFQIGSP
jgi:hypothetical protein